MSAIISKEDVEKVAKLARININELEQEKFSRDLSSILGHFKELNQLSVGQVEKIDFLSTEANQTRQDVARANQEEEKEAVRSQFPDREENYLKVKAVL